ncbi:MAG: rRNA maturation RNase YbeY [Chloroflexi bacterium]|nr:rRNA maturation RNase YbeY [Chloroflexota bacterium]
MTPAPPEPSEPGSRPRAPRPARSTRRPRTQVHVQVDDPYVAEVDARSLKEVVVATLLAEGRPGVEVTVVITGDEAVAGLNARFCGVDGPTDVLSFPAQEPAGGFVAAPGAASYLGDIVIALPYTRRQAAELGRSLADELRLLAVHGALHLLGYDHAQPDDEAAMWARQDAVLGRRANSKWQIANSK